MDRTEARRRLESSTDFVFVGHRVVIRSVRVLDALATPAPDGEGLRVVAHDEQQADVVSELAA